jgi:hypothetical protein
MADLTALVARVDRLEAELAAARAHTRSVEAWAEGIQGALLALVPPLLKALPEAGKAAMSAWEGSERSYAHLLRGGTDEKPVEYYESATQLARLSRLLGVPSPAGIYETPEQIRARLCRERGVSRLSPQPDRGSEGSDE